MKLVRRKMERENRTGRQLAPERAEALIEAAAETEPSSEGDAAGVAAVRLAYAAEGEPTGSIPRTSGRSRPESALLADKLGERLAYERSGVRLYDGLIAKAAAGSWPGGPSVSDLEHIREEERAHALLVEQAIVATGGDPSALTPAANLHAVASKGLCSIIADPRTSLRESLEAILVAELVDNDAWRTLAELARAAGHADLADSFLEPVEQETEHLHKVRTWLDAALLGGALASGPRAPAAEPSRSTSRASVPARTRRASRPARKTKASPASKRSGRKASR